MKKQEHKLNHEEDQEQVRTAAQQAHGQAHVASGREFSNPEAMLREDAAQTQVPPGIARKLCQSIARESPAKRPWWLRWLGRSN